MSQYFSPDALKKFAQAQDALKQALDLLALQGSAEKNGNFDVDDRYMAKKYQKLIDDVFLCWFDCKRLKEYVDSRYFPEELK